MKYLTEFKTVVASQESFDQEVNNLSKEGWTTADNVKIMIRGEKLMFIQQWQKTNFNSK